MRKILLAFIPVLCLALALGCQEKTKEQTEADAKKKKADADAEAKKKKADADAEAARKKADADAEAKKKKTDADTEYNEAKVREAYRKEMEPKLKKLDEKIEHYETKIKTAKGEKKVTMEKTVTTLKTQRKTLQGRFEEGKADTKAAWDKIREGIGNAYTELETAINNASKEFD